MAKRGFKHSLEFLKQAFREGPAQRRLWALEELRKRWIEVDQETQAKMDIFNPEKPQT